MLHAMAGNETMVEADVSGTMDFLHTARLRLVAVTDSAGSPLSGYSLESGSGLNYLNLSDVPEPASTALFLLGAVALAIAGHRTTR